MQLDGFAHQIFYDRLCTGACGIRPVHKFTFHDRGTLLRTPLLFSFLLSQLLCLLDAVVLGFLGYLLSSDDLQASLDRVVCQRITGMLDLRHTLLSGFLFCRFLGFQFLACHLVRPYEDAVFPSTETPQQGGWQDDCQEKIFRAEESLSVYEECREEDFQSIIERCTGSKEEINHALPYLERMVMFHSESGYVERQDEQHHGNDEMVGHDAGNHHISEGEEQQGEDMRCRLVEIHYLPEDSLQEESGIESAEYLDDYRDEKGTVVACDFHQPHINKVRNIHIEGEQRMAIYIICCAPVAQYPVGKRVEARYAEVADEILVIIIRDEGKMTGIAGYHHPIQNGKRQKNAHGEPSFFFLDRENIEYLFHIYLFLSSFERNHLFVFLFLVSGDSFISSGRILLKGS